MGKVTDLSALISTNVAETDVIYLVDVSAGTSGSKKITVSELRMVLMGAKGVIDSSMTFTTTGAATAIQPEALSVTFQAVSDGSHSGTTTIDVEVSNDNSTWYALTTLSVTGAADSDVYALDPGTWGYIRGNCTAHGDSTNTVTLYISY